MRKLVPWGLALLALGGTVLGHWGLSGCSGNACGAESDASEGCAPCGPAVGYWQSGAWFVGLSYGLGFGFLTLVVAERALVARRGGLRAAAAGATGAGVLWLGVCWLTGCCGSPLLPLYVSWIGGEFLGITRPLVFVLTVASVALSAVWLRRSRRRSCGCAACGPESEVGVES